MKLKPGKVYNSSLFTGIPGLTLFFCLLGVFANMERDIIRIWMISGICM